MNALWLMTFVFLSHSWLSKSEEKKESKVKSASVVREAAFDPVEEITRNTQWLQMVKIPNCKATFYIACVNSVIILIAAVDCARQGIVHCKRQSSNTYVLTKSKYNIRTAIALVCFCRCVRSSIMIPIGLIVFCF
jgi:hypothetical protein